MSDGKYLVELQEYAWALLLEVVSVRLGAGAPFVHRNFANLTLWRWVVERAVDTVVFFLVVCWNDRGYLVSNIVETM